MTFRTILTITGPHMGDDDLKLAADLCVARHGVKVTVARLPSENHSVADVLRQHSVDSSAELMVMGTYGHSRLHERIFGGVTKSMVEDQSMPVLMAR